MPTLPKKHKPRHGKAPRHNVIRNRNAHRAMNTNSKAWRMLRAQVLLEERYTCRACGSFGDQVDHIDGQASAWTDYRRENLQCLCASCHSAKTMRELNASGRMHDHESRNH